jgi:hypothetical protein
MCGGSIHVYVSWKWVGLLFVPAFIASLVASRMLGAVGIGVVVGVLVLLSMRLKPA